MAHVSAIHAILQVRGGQQRRRWRDDNAEFDGREQDFPECDLVAEHQHQAVAACRTERRQVVGDAIRIGGELREGSDVLRAVLVDDVERGTFVGRGYPVEVIECPVELRQHGPVNRRTASP